MEASIGIRNLPDGICGSSFHMPGTWSLRPADRGVRSVSFEDVHDRKSYRRRQSRTFQAMPCASIQGKEYLAFDFVGLFMSRRFH